MKPSSSIWKLIDIDIYSATPKYLQLANSIIKAIREQKVIANDVLPSINELSFEFEVSRDTAEKGYKYLKKIGILGSFPGKGYFVKNASVTQSLKVFLLFNKLSAHKQIIYDSFVKALNDVAFIDFYIYNNDFSLFKKLLHNKQDDYTHFVIIPHFNEGDEKAAEVINTIPREKLVILDKLLPGMSGEYSAVYENFAQDIYDALEQALTPLSK